MIDVKPGSPTYSQIVHTVTMRYKGDEFHHFGWNACSSALSSLTGHAFLERRYLIIPGIRSSRGPRRPSHTLVRLQFHARGLLMIGGIGKESAARAR